MSSTKSILEEVSKIAGQSRTVIIDAQDTILGRMCTIIAKLLLKGYRVYVINAEKAVVSGERRSVIEGYKLFLEVRTHRNPYKRGIRRPRTPINIIKRTVRGMLPKENTKGFEALRRLKVYIGVPEELSKLPRIRILDASISRLAGKYVYLADIARELGWKG
ncbi:MAG: 50S ribosomal protein L13 [Desulfurococcales archaeon]|jgi:large subunit ribosomal protein L13|nr:50S ribosomal protein L13 [Desulfurococcales archaeon]